MDMLVSLTHLPEIPELGDIRVIRVLPPNKGMVLDFIYKHFGQGWSDESSIALSRQPNSCFIAVRENQILGFACYDATAKGYFGPIGVDPEVRGKKIGQALLLSCLHAMAWDGYGYAVIGDCDDAAGFYRTIGAVPIPDSSRQNTVYSRMLFRKKQENA